MRVFAEALAGDDCYCGYGAAVGGDKRAQQGIMLLTGAAKWEEAQAAYRVMLFAVGANETKKGRAITQEDLKQTLAAGGRLSMPTVLRCRMRYLTNTLVLGSAAFVEEQLGHYRKRSGARLRQGPRPLPGYTDWGGLFALRAPKFGV